jgi:hypothetical protein
MEGGRRTDRSGTDVARDPICLRPVAHSPAASGRFAALAVQPWFITSGDYHPPVTPDDHQSDKALAYRCKPTRQGRRCGEAFRSQTGSCEAVIAVSEPMYQDLAEFVIPGVTGDDYLLYPPSARLLTVWCYWPEGPSAA